MSSWSDWQVVKAARRKRIEEGLRTLSTWAAARASQEHDAETTLTMLAKKVAELQKSADKAGWAAMDAHQKKEHEHQD